MGIIKHIYQNNSGLYPSGIELILDSKEKIIIGNSSAGIKIYEIKLFIISKLIWRCDNPFLIENIFPVLKTNFVGSPLEKLADDIILRFKTKQQLINFLETFKINAN